MNTDPRNESSWTIDEARDLYQIDEWGSGYFGIDDRGQVIVNPAGPGTRGFSLHDLAVDLQRRGHQLPVLVRFSEILRHRLQTLNEAFGRAITEYGYQSTYRSVYPIKVNQQSDIVEELLEYGDPLRMGLEAGSKPELLVALAYLDQPDGVIVCNGYKDAVYIETALLAQELGRHPILVIDRFAELELIIRLSERVGVRPHIGIRARLVARGSGRWDESSGANSKFGLGASEIVQVIERLRAVGMLDCVDLLHFHIGSQVTEIRAIKEALRESARIYVEMHRLGACPKFLDVGGGLGVDYEGSQSNSPSSINYDLQEYANDVIDAVQRVCDDAGVPHPEIISESGRALCAYHSVLIFDALGTNRVALSTPPTAVSEADALPIRGLFEALSGVDGTNFLEIYHDALQLKEEASNLFSLGFLDLVGRARAEDLFRAICLRVRRYAREMEFAPDELEGLERELSDTYFCNFSVFQSVPDSWAIDQLFPVMPIHRLDERPTCRGTLADLTCDSDGKVARFIGRDGVKDTLELHPVGSDPYYIGMFLVGAYQETLGDLHNLFGDTTAVHISLDTDHGYRITRVIEGDTVKEVLAYVRYSRRGLMRRVRSACEEAVRRGALSMEHSARLVRRFEEGLSGYTYLAREHLEVEEFAGAVVVPGTETTH